MMDTSKLPLEIFIQIFQHLPPICTWRLQSTSRAWHDALSSSDSINTILKGRTLKTFKQWYLSKPVSYLDISAGSRLLQRYCAFNDHYFAHMIHWSHLGVPKPNQLFIHDLEGGRIQVPIDVKSNVSSDLVMGDVVAFHNDSTLYMCTMKGEMRIRHLPGTFKGAIGANKHKIAVMQGRQPQDHHFQNRGMRTCLLWIYDYQQDVWELVSIPGIALRSFWSQGLIVEDNVHVISVAMDPHRERRAIWEECTYIMRFQTAGGSEWTARYKVKNDRSPSNYCEYMACTAVWTGKHYHVHVHTGQGFHNVFITLEGIVSVEGGTFAEWDDLRYTAMTDGIETPRGFLWSEYPDNRCHQPSLLLVNENYLVSINNVVDTGWIKAAAFRFGGQHKPFDRDVVWEEEEDNRSNQIARRRQVVCERDIRSSEEQSPVTQPG